MDLTDVMQMGQQLLISAGLPYFDLLLFDLPDPLGFRFRNTIALNALYAMTHDDFDIAGVLLHERAHGHLDRNNEEAGAHGDVFELACLRLGGDVTAPPLQNEDFKNLVQFYRDEEKLKIPGDSCLAIITEELSRWTDAGIQGRDDPATFMAEPFILGISIYERQ